MPAWWPQGESWPPKTDREPRPYDVHRFPIRVAVLFAIALHLIAIGLLRIKHFADHAEE